MNWQSHDLISELLLRAAGADVSKRKIAGLIRVSYDWCWDAFLLLLDPLMEWALDVLAGYVLEGDDAPDVLRERANSRNDESPGESVNEPAYETAGEGGPAR